MCGIAGIIQLTGELSARQRSELTLMSQALVHRGPDGQGEFHSPRVMLANQRLKLLDLSDAGAQPMCSHDGHVVVTFNGEISNYLEISQKYELHKKFPFKSQTDTEVLLYLYSEIGVASFSELAGMFAIILYDKVKEEVYVVRDNYGITPLFYLETEERLYVASEIKALIKIKPELTLDIQAFYDLFTLAYIPGLSTPYQEIKELKAGHFLRIQLKHKRINEERYYRIAFKPQDWKEASAIEATREALISSVERHMRSDAPVGAMLSGGIDTSSLVGMVKHLGLTSNFHTFSLSIQDVDFDESRYQKIMADYAKSEHHQINVGIEEVHEVFYQHLAFMDEPYGHGAALPTFLLAREARKYVKALLSGEGGDELFNAYETHGAHWWKQRYRKLPSFLRQFIRHGVESMPVSFEKLSLDFKLKRFCLGAELPLHQSHLYWRHVLPDETKARLFSEEWHQTDRLAKQLFTEFKDCDEFSQLSAWDIEQFFFGDLMVKNDRMCLAHSVESRFPYMDRIVTEVVTSIPSELKIKSSRRRHLQKEAMKPFLPQEIYQRSGFGLEMPYNKWFSGELASIYSRYFNPDYFEHLPFLNWQIFQELWKGHQRRRFDVGRFLWTTLILCAWYDIHHLSKNAHDHRRLALQNKS